MKRSNKVLIRYYCDILRLSRKSGEGDSCSQGFVQSQYGCRLGSARSVWVSVLPCRCGCRCGLAGLALERRVHGVCPSAELVGGAEGGVALLAFQVQVGLVTAEADVVAGRLGAFLE